MADEDVIKGQVEQTEGKVQNAYGNATGDIKHQAEGAAKQVGGAVQEGWGRLKDDVRAGVNNDRAERQSE